MCFTSRIQLLELYYHSAGFRVFFYQPGTWANKLRGIFQGDRPQPGQPLLVPQLGVPVPLDLPLVGANTFALGPFLPIQVSGSSPFVPEGRLPVEEATGQRLPCILAVGHTIAGYH